ncbi:MAG: zinc ribbon domain-containing protein [Casimicrobiaceae bacterium]
MPIYEYRCSACGHELEALRKLSEAPLLTCPACAKDTLTKLLSAAGFQLKGSGWYATDFKGSGSKPAAKAEGDKAADGKAVDGKTADGKPADAKPAAGTESKSDTASETKAAPAATPAGGTSSGTSST